MALLFLESFGHVNSGSLLSRKWTTVTGSESIVAGRSPTGSACQITNGQLTTQPLGGGSSMGAGWAMQFQQSGTFLITGNGFAPFTVNLLVTAAGVFQLLVDVNDGSAITNPSAFSIHFGQWYYLELTCTITNFDATTVTISYDLHVNGISVLAGTLVTTGIITGHAPNFLGVVWGNNGSWLFTDIYVTDGEILGEVNILPLFRAADGDATAWTPNIPGSHFLMVDQHSPDDNTTYIASSTAGQEDMGTMDQISGVTGTIKGIQGVWNASMLGGDSASGGYKSSGTTVLAANPFPLGLYTLYSLDPRRKSAFTGLDWTIAEINAMQLDCKKIS